MHSTQALHSAAFVYEGRIDLENHPECHQFTGSFLVTIGGWNSVAGLADRVTRGVRRFVKNSPPFSGGPPQRFDIFSYETLTARQRLLNTEPDTLKLYGPITLLLTKRQDETPVADPHKFRSRFDAGSFDFGHLQKLVATSISPRSRRS